MRLHELLDDFLFEDKHFSKAPVTTSDATSFGAVTMRKAMSSNYKELY